jgi:hypothetical protein
VRVEAAFAVGAEKVGNAYAALAQHEFQVVLPAFRTGFADAAEAQYVKRLVFIVEVVDHHARIQFAEDQDIVGGLTTRWLAVLLLGWRHCFR